MGKLETRMSIEDLKFLKQMNNIDKKYDAQKKIIDALIELYNLYKPYITAEDVWKEADEKGAVFFKETKKNIIKVALFTAASTIVANKLIVCYDPSLPELVLQTGFPAMIGYKGFQYFNEKENYLNAKNAEDTREYFEEICNKVGEKTETFTYALSGYLRKYDEGESWEELSSKIFDTQRVYIENQKEENKVNKSFNKDIMNDILEYYLEDISVLEETMNDLRTINQLVQEKNKVKIRK